MDKNRTLSSRKNDLILIKSYGVPVNTTYGLRYARNLMRQMDRAVNAARKIINDI